jgi:hypothetical protein
MDKSRGATRILVDHFFRRFFDNDTVQPDGDTQTTVVRAVSFLAVPGLMVAFWLINAYPYLPPRPLWATIADHYFFVMFSFVAMGGAAIFEWEMLFPDRLDFLVLSPLPIRPMQMLGAKAAALIGFLGLFLVASNLFGTVLLPMVSKGTTLLPRVTLEQILRQMVAHGVAVGMAGVFAALFFLALGGVLLCVLGAARFRVVSPIVQVLSVMALGLLLLFFPWFGISMHGWLTEPLGNARWVPPLWFLGVYEQLLRGDEAPAFAREMAWYAVRGTATVAALVLLTYPLAWARMRKLAFEGGSQTRREPSRWLAALAHQVVRRPGERAVFHFIGQTIRRNNRYQVYLAMYCGVGQALALALAVTLRVSGGRVRAELSNDGLHAVMPLLLFWVVAGLRTAFAFPVSLQAGWVFRITGVNLAECAAAARKWVLLCALAAMGGIMGALVWAGWDARRLLVQAVWGLGLCVLLTDGFFFSQKSVPFNQPRMPGRVSFPLMLTLYVGVFPLFVYEVIEAEMRMEKHLAKLLIVAIAAVSIHAATAVGRRGTEEIEEEMQGYEGEFQLLGLGEL